MRTPSTSPEETGFDPNSFGTQLHQLLGKIALERHPEIATAMFGETTTLDSFRFPTDEIIALIAETILAHPEHARNILGFVGKEVNDTCCDPGTMSDIRNALQMMTLQRVIEKMAKLPRPKRGKTQPGQAISGVVDDTRKAALKD